MILDLFAGPGGWSEGLRSLGGSEVGIEWEPSACATRAAAGHATVRADVATYPPPRARVDGLIASPPCQAFSNAGQRGGFYDIDYLFSHVHACQTGWCDTERRPWLDRRAALVLEPLRWVDALVPRWVALEQVPPVLPLWEAMAGVLRGWGYSVWTGILNAADFGVPQTRRRAILMAARDRAVVPPEPTHCKGGADGLFGTLAPWVSMAEALGWGIDDRPCLRVTSGGTATGGAEPIAHAGRAVAAAATRGSWVVRTGANTMKHSRDPDEVELYERPVTEPAPTVDAKAGSAAKAGGQWVFDRPATTVAGDPRISPPDWRGRPEDYTRDGEYVGERSMDHAIRVTIREGLILQGFRSDYPVQGTRTKQWEQVGNAVPPPLAAAVLRGLS